MKRLRSRDKWPATPVPSGNRNGSAFAAIRRSSLQKSSGPLVSQSDSHNSYCAMRFAAVLSGLVSGTAETEWARKAAHGQKKKSEGATNGKPQTRPREIPLPAGTETVTEGRESPNGAHVRRFATKKFPVFD